MTEALAVRHVAFEDLGTFEEVLEERDIQVTYVDAGRGRLREEVERRSPELLVVLGGPVGAGETTAYPFLTEEIELVRARLSREEPLLGVCLGAQLIAAAAGAKVYPAAVQEIGWQRVDLTAAGADSPLGELTAPVLHWHGDTFDLPTEAVHLASTPQCANQAFALGRRALGVQFHPEVRGAAIESWLIGHAHEIAHAPGVSPTGIREDTRRYAGLLESQCRRFFGRWLDDVGL
ncbi:glutamine amidotransferase [Streptomyces sp. ODS28]|uniref:glutamine amidotransferase n=1 Tax=Streptomyces sp. ODS28 TaxID=3136688 RepID=UPI0031E74182